MKTFHRGSTKSLIKTNTIDLGRPYEQLEHGELILDGSYNLCKKPLLTELMKNAKVRTYLNLTKLDTTDGTDERQNYGYI